MYFLNFCANECVAGRNEAMKAFLEKKGGTQEKIYIYTTYHIPHVKATHLLNALKGQAPYVLHWNLKE
jgi:hypothetical protein